MRTTCPRRTPQNLQDREVILALTVSAKGTRHGQHWLAALMHGQHAEQATRSTAQHVML